MMEWEEPYESDPGGEGDGDAEPDADPVSDGVTLPGRSISPSTSIPSSKETDADACFRAFNPPKEGGRCLIRLPARFSGLCW
jgi:hypothetical protein